MAGRGDKNMGQTRLARIHRTIITRAPYQEGLGSNLIRSGPLHPHLYGAFCQRFRKHVCLWRGDKTMKERESIFETKHSEGGGRGWEAREKERSCKLSNCGVVRDVFEDTGQLAKRETLQATRGQTPPDHPTVSVSPQTSFSLQINSDF